MRHSCGKAPRIRIRFSFLVFSAIAFTMRECGILLQFFAVCALHEAGHITAASITKAGISSVDITGFGIRMETSRRRITSVYSDLFVLLAGPAVNLLIYFVFSSIDHTFALLSLAAAVYNLLPYDQLDGGAVIRLFTSGTPFEPEICRLLTIVKVAFSAVLLAALLASGKVFLPLFIFSLLLILSEKKIR